MKKLLLTVVVLLVLILSACQPAPAGTQQSEKVRERHVHGLGRIDGGLPVYELAGHRKGHDHPVVRVARHPAGMEPALFDHETVL